jgi:RNA polymerase-binding transcription factor DksA
VLRTHREVFVAEVMVDLVSARKGLNAHLTRLDSELVELQKARESARHDKDETAGYGNHVGEAATETFEAERDLALIDNLEQMRGHVKDALQRIDEGTYGRCVTCAKPIPVERLEALPHASQCVSCKSKEPHH